MASKSMKNIVSVIALANGIALVMKQATTAHTPTTMATRLDAACKEAFELWPGSLEKRELAVIYNRLAAFEEANIPEQGRPEFLTSIALGLFDDLAQMVKDPVKRTALLKVENALWKIHTYYDRRLDRWDLYERANQCIAHWNMH